MSIKIEHIGMYTKDLEKAKEFYEKYFNVTANEIYHNKVTGLRTYFFTFPGSDTRLEILSRPELKDRTDKVMDTGFIHLAVSLGSKEAVDELTARLVNDGHLCLSGPRTTGDGYYESVVEDLDGNLLELTI